MNKGIFILLVVCILPFSTALGDRWDLIFSDGTTTINGTDVCLESGKCLSDSGTGAGDIEAVNAIGNYITGGGTSGSVDIDLNETYLNETITTIATALGGSGDNSSWNESYANTLYISTSDEGNLNVNSSDYWDSYNTANSTWFENLAGVLSLKLSELTSYLDTWLGTKDTDDLAQGSTNLYDNSTWNESYADTKYATIGAGADNESWNESYADTLYYGIDNPSSFWNDTYATFNKTYADTLYADISVVDTDTNETTRFDALVETDCGAGNLVIGVQANGTVLCAGDQTGDGGNPKSGDGIYLYNDTNIMYFNETKMNETNDLRYAPISVTGDNSSWNETYADTLYADISVVDTDDQTCAEVSGCVENAITDGNTGWDNSYGFWNDTFATFNKTYADTLYASISVTGDNSSWNESYANTLYAVIGYGDDWNKTYADTLYADIGVTGDNSSWNESYANTLYYDISNPSTFWNATFALFNKTYADTLYADISVTGDDASWNKTYADTLYASISVTGDNESWNETYANTLYAPLNYGDDWNKTYADTLYADISVVDTNILTDSDFNATQMENSGGVLNILESWLTTFFNSLFSGKTTDDLTQGSANLYDNSTWNQTLADSLYAPISVTGDNSSWNETYARTLFYDEESDLTTLLDNNYAPLNYGDDWNKTYADTLYMDIAQDDWVDTTGDTMTGNLNMSTGNITLSENNYTCYNQECTSYIYYNGTGLIIQG